MKFEINYLSDKISFRSTKQIKIIKTSLYFKYSHSVLHRMTLISHVHSSQFMEWQNLSITTPKYAKCAPNVFKKLPENWITLDFIYLTSSNFVAISHISYWDQVNSWKSLWKFWNDPLCRIVSGPSPYSMLQDIGRVATPTLVSRNCLRYLQTTLIMGGGGLVSEFMTGIVGVSDRMLFQPGFCWDLWLDEF